MGANVWAITMDCADPARLVEFWAAALGFRAEDAGDAWGALTDPTGRRPRMFFQRVPEAKAGKNRLHVDLFADAGMEAEVERLTALGARALEQHGEFGLRWTVMQDPEGNEFCVGEPAPPHGAS